MVTQEPARKTSPKPPWNYGAGGTMGRGVFQVCFLPNFPFDELEIKEKSYRLSFLPKFRCFLKFQVDFIQNHKFATISNFSKTFF